MGLSACTRPRDATPHDTRSSPVSTKSVAKLLDRYPLACTAVLSCIPAAKLTISECATRRTAVGLLVGGGVLDEKEVDCIASAGGNCDAVARCVGASPGAPPCERPSERSCEGNVARGCHVGLDVQTDEACSSGDSCLKCTSRERCCGKPCAQRSACVDGAPTRCDVETQVASRRCGDVGMVCAEHPTAVADCVGLGPKCQPNLSGRCELAELIACASGGEFRVSCKELGGRHCTSWVDQSSITHARCEAGPQQCDREGCDGSKIRFCDDGANVELDCHGIGFERCVANGSRALCAH